MQYKLISAMTRGIVRHDLLDVPLALHRAQQRLEQSQTRGVLDVMLRTVAARKACGGLQGLKVRCEA